MGTATLQEGQSGLPTPQSTESYWHREPSEVLLGHRTTERLPATADVVVVGSGMTGAFAARELVAGGRAVVMLEAREACWGATGRNGGHCQPAIYSSKPHIARFELATYRFLEELVASNGVPCEWRRVGGVHGLPTRELVELAAESIARLRGGAPDLADKAALFTDGRDLEALRVPAAAGAVLQPCAARCWPYKLVAWVLERLLSGNGDGDGEEDVLFNLQTGTPVTHLQRLAAASAAAAIEQEEEQEGEARWVVHTPRGQIAAREVLLATNAYTSSLLPRMTGLIVPVRGQVSALEPPSGSVPLEHTHVWLTAEGGSDDYLIQRDNDDDDSKAAPGPIIVGGERMSERARGEGVWWDDEVEEEVARRLRRALYPALKLRPHGGQEEEEEELEALWEWTGIMGYSKDGKPWVGPVPEELGGGSGGGGGGGLWVCAGYTGHGMPVAARCAVGVAEMMLGRGGGGGGVELPEEFLVSVERAERARGMELKRSGVDQLRMALMEATETE